MVAGGARCCLAARDRRAVSFLPRRGRPGGSRRVTAGDAPRESVGAAGGARGRFATRGGGAAGGAGAGAGGGRRAVTVRPLTTFEAVFDFFFLSSVMTTLSLRSHHLGTSGPYYFGSLLHE